MILTDAGIDAMLDVRESLRFWVRFLIGDGQAADQPAPVSNWKTGPFPGGPATVRRDWNAEKEGVDVEFHV